MTIYSPSWPVLAAALALSSLAEAASNQHVFSLGAPAKTHAKDEGFTVPMDTLSCQALTETMKGYVVVRGGTGVSILAEV